MTQRQGNDRAVEDVRAAQARAQAQVQHATAFVASQGLHAGVVHDAHSATEGLGIIEVDPAVRKIVRIGRGMAVAHLARIADRDALKFPVGGNFLHAVDQFLRREFFTGCELFLVPLAGLPYLHVRAANIDNENVHGRRVACQWLKPYYYDSRTAGMLSTASRWQRHLCPVAADPLFADPAAERLGHNDGAVRLLAVLENGDESAAHGDRRAIERVHEVRALFALALEANVESARLIVGAIRGARDF